MASEYTTHYNLDKYVGTDKPNLRDQYNAAVDKIDAELWVQHGQIGTALNAANTAVGQANSAIEQVGGKASQADLTALSTTVTSIQGEVDAIEQKLKSNDTYMIGVGDSWLMPSLYGGELAGIFETHGIQLDVYGNSGAGWIKVYNNKTVVNSVDAAIAAHSDDGEKCTDVFIINMQNDRDTWATGSYSAITTIIQQNYRKLRAAFPRAKLHTIFDYDYKYFNFGTLMKAYKAYSGDNSLAEPIFDASSVLLGSDYTSNGNHLNSSGQLKLARAMISLANGQTPNAVFNHSNLVTFNTNTHLNNVSVGFMYSPQTNFATTILYADFVDVTESIVIDLTYTGINDNRFKALFLDGASGQSEWAYRRPRLFAEGIGSNGTYPIPVQIDPSNSRLRIIISPEFIAIPAARRPTSIRIQNDRFLEFY